MPWLNLPIAASKIEPVKNKEQLELLGSIEIPEFAH
jgi:hypothetical protein